jgi:hypothetical protein
MSDVISPDKLKEISDQIEMEKAKKLLEKQRKLEEEQRNFRDVFMNRKPAPDADERFNEWVRKAAESGDRERMAFSFPSSFCTDGGRAINNFDPSWPETLTGFAKQAYEYFETKLKPNGYKMRMQIINYPGGVPGDVGVFIGW